MVRWRTMRCEMVRCEMCLGMPAAGNFIKLRKDNNYNKYSL